MRVIVLAAVEILDGAMPISSDAVDEGKCCRDAHRQKSEQDDNSDYPL